MLKKRYSFVVAAVVGLFMIMECDSPTTTAPAGEIFFGKWVGFGYNTVSGGEGYTRNDTMKVELTIEKSSYSLHRDYLERNSGGGSIPDTIKEQGSWLKVGSDSLVLTPAQDKCVRWDKDWAKVSPGEPNPPVRLKIDITNNTWKMDMQNLKDPDMTTAVTLKKQ